MRGQLTPTLHPVNLCLPLPQMEMKCQQGPRSSSQDAFALFLFFAISEEHLEHLSDLLEKEGKKGTIFLHSLCILSSSLSLSLSSAFSLSWCVFCGRQRLHSDHLFFFSRKLSPIFLFFPLFLPWVFKMRTSSQL